MGEGLIYILKLHLYFAMTLHNYSYYIAILFLQQRMFAFIALFLSDLLCVFVFVVTSAVVVEGGGSCRQMWRDLHQAIYLTKTRL